MIGGRHARATRLPGSAPVPTVSSERILLKASFVTPLVETPELLVGRRDRRRDPAEAIDTLEPFHVSRWAHR